MYMVKSVYQMSRLTLKICDMTQFLSLLVGEFARVGACVSVRFDEYVCVG